MAKYGWISIHTFNQHWLRFDLSQINSKRTFYNIASLKTHQITLTNFKIKKKTNPSTVKTNKKQTQHTETISTHINASHTSAYTFRANHTHTQTQHTRTRPMCAWRVTRSTRREEQVKPTSGTRRRPSRTRPEREAPERDAECQSARGGGMCGRARGTSRYLLLQSAPLILSNIV